MAVFKKRPKLNVVQSQGNSGSGETKQCACEEVWPKVKHVDITCSCPNTKTFLKKPPARWICDDCRSNKHTWLG